MSRKAGFKNGVPVLAYAHPSEIEQPWLLGSLLLKNSSLHNQISLFLSISISVPGSTEEQSFVLVYDADNLVSWKTSLAPDAGGCDPAWLEKISACPVWYKRSPLPHFTPCQQLVDLAKADKLHLVIDFSWLQKTYETCIRRLASNVVGLTGFPAGESLSKHHERGDWTIFQPLELLNDPPAYVEKETLHKRTRRATSLTSSPPPAKRAVFEAEAPTYPAGSPTEIATPPSCDVTTIDESSPKSMLAERSIETSEHPHLSDQQYAAISAAVAYHLPHALEAFATRYFAHPYTSPSPPASDRNRNRNSKSSSPPPTRLPLSPHGAALISHMLPHLKKYLQSVTDRVTDHAYMRRMCADDEFREHLDDTKAEAEWNIKTIKDEGVDSLRDARNEIREEMEGQMNEDLGTFREHLETIYWEVVGKGENKAYEVARKVVVEVNEAARKMEDAAAEAEKAATKAERRAEALLAEVRAVRDEIEARGYVGARPRRNFRRGKGGYRGLGTRYLRR